MKNETMMLQIHAKGEIVSSNFPEFDRWVRDGLKTVNMDLVTDDDFADAETVVKNLVTVEDGIKAAKVAMLAQAEQLHQAFADMDNLSDDTAKVRLGLARQITKRKEEIREQLLESALASVDCAPRHRHRYSRSLSEAMKGKKNLASITKALEVIVACHNASIKKSRSKIDALIADYGTSLVMDRFELEIETPDHVEQELRRRVEAHLAEIERQRLQAVVDKSRAEAAALRQAEIARQHAEAKAAQAEAKVVPFTPAVGTAPALAPSRTVGPPQRPAPEPPDWRGPQEPDPVKDWQWFGKVFITAMSAVKEARAQLTDADAIARASVLSEWVNDGWKAANRKGDGQ
jgi:hypothetical protein